jgi:hypothetical protein
MKHTRGWLFAATCILFSLSAPAAQLVSETFESLSGTTLPAGWTLVDNNPGTPTFSIVTGHNGSGGSAGKGGKVTNVDPSQGTGDRPGSWMQPPVVAAGSQPFTATFDVKTDNEATADDAVILFGNISGGTYYYLFFTEAAVNNDLFRVTGGARIEPPAIDQWAGSFVNNIWYRITITWTPTSGTVGTLSVSGVRVVDGVSIGNINNFSLTMDSNVQFGFGSFNDNGTFDNIVINGTDGNLVTAVGDQVEVGVGGAIAFNPMANDTGNFNPASLAILSGFGPTQGTAVFDSAQGKVIYNHTGPTSGSDSFRYQISSFSGTTTSQATVNVSISNAMRLANATLNMPPDPPAGGSLQLVDAFPGLTFDGLVSLASVPGSPEKLIVASAHGASTGSDSKVWMVPNTAAASPQKFELFEVDSLCPAPFTRGRGIYSVVCHPSFATTGYLIVCYQGNLAGLPPTNQIPNLEKNGLPDSTIECTLRIARFTISPANLAILINPSSTSTQINNARAQILASEIRYLNLAEQHLFHSINDCHFGPDGYLYVSFGDEGDQGEPYRNAQYITKDQFSSIIRIDVDKQAGNLEPNPHYAIPLDGTGNAYFSVPADNPYVGTSVFYNGTTYTPSHPDFGKIRTEIWATGFRNPFKFDLDNNAGVTEAWVGDVGRDLWEEVSIVRKGEDAGWSYWEGSHLSGISHAIAPASHRPPEYDYAHANGNNCVIGGVFYRGTAYAAPLQGKYIFGDHGSGRLWTLDPTQPAGSKVQDLGVGTIGQVVDFHVDPLTGEILIGQYQVGKKIYRLKEGTVGGNFPQLLSQTGAFADLQTLKPNPGIVPYSPNLTFWSDNAEKRRFFVIKNLTDQVTYSRDGNWTFPNGMVFVKHFDMDLNRDNPGTNLKRLETRFLVRNTGGLYGVAYRWNDQGTEATLVGTGGVDFDLQIQQGGQMITQSWHIPSRGECITCHNPNAGHALSLNTRQLNKSGQINVTSGNFLSLLSNSGYLGGFTDNPATLERYYRPNESQVNLENRVRSYLGVNCSHCHQPNSGIVESWDARGHLSVDGMRILYGIPVSETYHEPDDYLIKPGDKVNSVIWNRIQARSEIGDGTYHGYSQMPPLATRVVDAAGVQLLSDWIDNYANVAPTITGGSLSNTDISENATVGTVVGTVTATDPDVRSGQADNSFIRYAITSGDSNHIFSIDPVTGQVTVNGILDYESTTQFLLGITATDNFGPNPRDVAHSLTINLLDVTTGDASEDANGNGIPDAWELTFGVSGASPGGDIDSDGIATFFEWLGSSNPTIPDGPGTFAVIPIARLSQPTPGYQVEWRVRNGVILGQRYFAAAATSLAGPWQTLQIGDYQIVSVTPDGPGMSKMRIFVPTPSEPWFFRLTTSN